jgi:crossover junction endodeoxyribonuclease RuvC
LNSEKDASRTKVIEMYPYIAPMVSRKKDSNKADAILIGMYYFENLEIK